MLEYLQQKNYGPIELIVFLVGLGVCVVILSAIKDLLVAKIKKGNWNGKDERRENPGGIIIDEKVITRVVEAFENHTKLMQELVSTLNHVDEHILDNRKIVTAHYGNLRQDIQNLRANQ